MIRPVYYLMKCTNAMSPIMEPFLQIICLGAIGLSIKTDVSSTIHVAAICILEYMSACVYVFYVNMHFNFVFVTSSNEVPETYAYTLLR